MIGEILGRYRIDAHLATGGMGAVYRGYDLELQRSVAIKILTSIKDDQSARTRLLAEARAASSLNHPNICTVYEVGKPDGPAFIAMELVDGSSLNELMPPDGLPVEAVLRHGIEIAEALAYAHQHGILHRDLSARNVMVTQEGRVKVLDFGLAQRLERADLEEITRSFEPEAVGGTLPYMAPEILRGQSADERSDIWALGVVLFEMAAGRLPFGGRTGFELSSAILRESPAQLPSAVPAGLRSVIARCLAKEPGLRYRQAGEARAALEAARDSSLSVRVPVLAAETIEGIPQDDSPPTRARRMKLGRATAATLHLFLPGATGRLIQTRTTGGWSQPRGGALVLARSVRGPTLSKGHRDCLYRQPAGQDRCVHHSRSEDG